MTKGELKAALAEAERVRDEWCAEYVKARDELLAMIAWLERRLKPVEAKR